MQSLEASKRASREIYTAEQSRWNRGWKNLTKYETGVSPERLADYEKSAMESLNGSYDLAMEAYVSTIKDASVTLFLDERTPTDALWHGPVPSFADLQKGLGVTKIEKRSVADSTSAGSGRLGTMKRRRSLEVGPTSSSSGAPAHHVVVDVSGGYVFPFVHVDDLRGFRAQASLRIHLW